MKVLIAYAGKYGSTETCALQLSKLLDGEVTMDNLADQSHFRAEDFDLVIIGSNIRFGRIDKRVKRFVVEQEKQIKACALFLTAGLQDYKEQYIKDNFSKELLGKTFVTECFGGKVSNAVGFDRLIVQLVANKCPDEISYGKIEQFAQAVNRAELKEVADENL